MGVVVVGVVNIDVNDVAIDETADEDEVVARLGREDEEDGLGKG